jgi:hypothetical protein
MNPRQPAWLSSPRHLRHGPYIRRPVKEPRIRLITRTSGRRRSCSGSLRRQPVRRISILVAHTVNLWPRLRREPAHLFKHGFAALHLLFPVDESRVHGQLVYESAAGVDELDKGWRGPVWDEGVVQSRNVRLGRRTGEGGCERLGILPRLPIGLWLLVNVGLAGDIHVR